MRRSETISRAFCSGEIRAKMVWFCAASSNSSSSSVSISAPVIVPLDAKPKSAQTFSATSGLSPVATLTSMPSAASCASESRAAGFGFVGEHQEAVQRQAAFVVGGDGLVSSGAGLLATATTRRPSANSADSVLLCRVGHRRRTWPAPARVRP